MVPWWPLVPLAVLLWAKGSTAKAKATRKATRHAGRLAVFPVDGGKLSTKPVHGYHYQRTPTHRHQGVDIFRPEGTPVLALMAGTVTHATQAWRKGFGGYGRVVVLRVPFRGSVYFVLYAHLASVDVKPGEEVDAGTQLGTVGRSKFTNADRTAMFATSNAHLHFELAQHRYPMAPEAARVDPTALLQAAHASPFSL